MSTKAGFQQPSKNTKLPDCDHLLRFIEKNRRMLDPNTNKIIGILPQAFELKPKELAAGYISSGWVEFFGSDMATNLCLTKKDILSVRNASKHPEVFALGNVGKVKNTVSKYHQRARIIYTPGGVKCHVSVLIHNNDNPKMLEELATLTWCNLV